VVTDGSHQPLPLLMHIDDPIHVHLNFVFL
jgi:hypothetical protein